MSSRKPRRYNLGGGVAVLYKNNLDVQRVKQKSKYSSFEFIECMLRTRSENYRFVNIYRVEYSQKHKITFQTFIDEFSELMSELILKKGKLVLVGDYNIHVENEADKEAATFKETLDLFNVHQLVNGPTHELGGTLDLIITQSKETIYDIETEEDCLDSDHNPINFKIDCTPVRKHDKIEISKRNLKDLNICELKYSFILFS